MILMPPYSPKYNPFEHTWSALKQKVAGCIQLYGAVSDALNAVYKASSYIDTSQLIVSVLRKLNQAMYAYDDNNMLIASGGTAGYCAIAFIFEHGLQTHIQKSM